LPEEEPVEPEPDDSLSQAAEFLSDLEAIINSGSLANGSGPTDKLDDELEEDLEDDPEENLLDVPTFGLEEPYTGEETNSESDFNSQSPNGVAYSVGQDDTAEENAVHPIANENYLPSDKENNMAGGPGSQTGDVSETPSGQSVEAGPGKHTSAALEANYAPITGTEVSPEKQTQAEENTAVEPQQIQETEEEAEPPIDVDSLILRFVEECCKTGDERSATANELYIAYLRW
jgi:hypothetical protein